MTSSIISTLVRRSSSPSVVATTSRQLFNSSSFPHLIKLSSASSKPTSYSLLHSLHFASSSSSAAVSYKRPSDEILSQVIQYEIQCVEDDHNQGGLMPDGFPFKIIDTPGEETITLKRQLDGETIEVLVHMPQMAEKENEDDEDGKNDKDDENFNYFEMSLIVTITKGDGSSLQFSCTATPTDITIDSMLAKALGEVAYEGPMFTDLSINLQKEFHKYLERRGIESSYTDFLQEYMVKQDDKEYVKWLKFMKQFLQK